MANVVDPLGGSYYVEWLTNRLEEEAGKILEAIQKQGGAFKAIDWMEKEMWAAAYQHQRSVDSGQRTVVGVNAFVDEDEPQWTWLRAQGMGVSEYDPSIRDKQIARLNKVKAERDRDKLEQAKEKLFQAYRSGGNMVPPLIEAVKSYITGGEIGEVRTMAMGDIEERVLSMQPMGTRGK